MSLEDEIRQKLGKTKKPPKKSNSTPRPRKLVIPNHIKIIFDNLDKSITSVWGPKSDGSNKWDAKYTMWISFKEWFDGVSKK